MLAVDQTGVESRHGDFGRRSPATDTTMHTHRRPDTARPNWGGGHDPPTVLRQQVQQASATMALSLTALGRRHRVRARCRAAQPA